MIKKTIAAILAVSLVMTEFVALPEEINLFRKSSITAYAETSGDFEYDIDYYDESVHITKYTGNSSEVVIPSKINGYDVHAIWGLGKNDKVTSIIIPDSVIHISNDSFAELQNLSKISLSGNNSEYKSIDGVLYNKDLTSIEAIASAVTEVSIPASVANADPVRFSSCNRLKSIKVDSNNTYFSSYDNALYEKDFSKLLCIPNNASSITIHANTTNIEDCIIGFDKNVHINVDSSNEKYISVDDALYYKYYDSPTTLLWIYPLKESLIIPSTVNSLSCYSYPQKGYYYRENGCFDNLKEITVEADNPWLTAVDNVL